MLPSRYHTRQSPSLESGRTQETLLDQVSDVLGACQLNLLPPGTAYHHAMGILASYELLLNYWALKRASQTWTN